MHRRTVGGVATPQRLAPTSAAMTAAAAAAAAVSGTPDTFLPGALPRPDNLLPRATRSKPAAHSKPAPAPAPEQPPAGTRARTRTDVRSYARAHSKRIVVLVVVAVALTLSLVAAWPVVFSNSPTPPASSATTEVRATRLLATVIGAGRTLYAPQHSFAGVTAGSLSAASYNVAIVAATTDAHVGQVSMRLTGTTQLTLATKIDATRCLFGRDRPTDSGAQFVTVTTIDCRASAAPANGWATR